MASVTNLSDIFKYIANNFGASNRWRNGDVSRRQAVNTTDAAVVDASEVVASTNVNVSANTNVNAGVDANANANGGKNAPAAAVKYDSAVVSSAAQTASSLHSQIKSTGSENAAIFRSALTSLVSNFSSSSNPTSGALGSFLGFGVAMAETGNLKTYTDMSLMVTSLSQLTSSSSSSLTSKSINQSLASFQSFGVETAGSFINSTQKIMSAGVSDGANKGSQISALNNLNKLWETTSKLSGFGVEQKTGMLANIAENIESKSGLSEINDYLKQQLEAVDEAAAEESLATASEEEVTVSYNTNVFSSTNGAYSRSSFASLAPADGFQSALQVNSLISGMNLMNSPQNINAYKNNMNLTAASALLNAGV